ncbi:AraC family transcriptional regulator [Actinomycetes bacterium M1A6_2h]
MDVARWAPVAELAPWVDYYWRVRWEGIEPHEQPVIPQSCIHLAAEQGRLLVHGINRRAFTRTLVGTGHVIGASFRPGCFRPFMRQSVRTLTDRVVPAGDVTGVDDVSTAAWLLESSRSDNDLVDGMNRWLLSVDIADDRVAFDVADLVSCVEQDRTVVRAEQLAAIAGVSVRTLQRRFVEYVGIGPKWVIQRSRMLDVAAAVHSDEPVDFAALANELGFSDQPHLTRAWTALVGSPPATYRSRA